VSEPGGDLDLAEEPLGSERGGQLRLQHLERDRAAELAILGEVNRGHATPTELPLDHVAVGQGGPEPLEDVGHLQLTSESRA
jgi:hypothetical protein